MLMLIFIILYTYDKTVEKTKNIKKRRLRRQKLYLRLN